MAGPESPCIRQCCLNEHDICLGCFRSLDEILNWSKASNDDKQRIIEQAQERKQQAQQRLQQLGY
jgi:predicted Fe-S protein YdhL (DUF1289 family)